MRRFTYKQKKFEYTAEVLTCFEKRITKFGNGAKIDAPKEHLGKKVIVLVTEG